MKSKDIAHYIIVDTNDDEITENVRGFKWIKKILEIYYLCVF